MRGWFGESRATAVRENTLEGTSPRELRAMRWSNPPAHMWRIAAGINPLKARKLLGPSQPLVRFNKGFGLRRVERRCSSQRDFGSKEDEQFIRFIVISVSTKRMDSTLETAEPSGFGGEGGAERSERVFGFWSNGRLVRRQRSFGSRNAGLQPQYFPKRLRSRGRASGVVRTICSLRDTDRRMACPSRRGLRVAMERADVQTGEVLRGYDRADSTSHPMELRLRRDGCRSNWTEFRLWKEGRLSEAKESSGSGVEDSCCSKQWGFGLRAESSCHSIQRGFGPGETGGTVRSKGVLGLWSRERPTLKAKESSGSRAESDGRSHERDFGLRMRAGCSGR
jgi:hypothetical protein